MSMLRAALALIALAGLFAPAPQQAVTITLVRWPFT